MLHADNQIVGEISSVYQYVGESFVSVKKKNWNEFIYVYL